MARCGYPHLAAGQANVRRWVPDILPLLTGDSTGGSDPLGVDGFATHRPLAEAPEAYRDFQHKTGGTKILLRP